MSSSATSQQQQQVPKWVAILIAMVILGAFLVGVALWVFSPAPPKDLTQVVGQGAGADRVNRAIVQAARARPAQPASPVSRRGNDIIVRAAKAELIATPQNNSWALKFTYTDQPQLFTADMQAAMLARNRLAIDAFYAKSLNVTDEQVKQLRDTQSMMNLRSGPIVVTDADRARVSKLLDAYSATANADTAEQLSKALTELAESRLEASRAKLAEQTNKIASILTPAQIAEFKPK